MSIWSGLELAQRSPSNVVIILYHYWIGNRWGRLMHWKYLMVRVWWSEVTIARRRRRTREGRQIYRSRTEVHDTRNGNQDLVLMKQRPKRACLWDRAAAVTKISLENAECEPKRAAGQVYAVAEESRAEHPKYSDRKELRRWLRLEGTRGKPAAQATMEI
jgi:hypothetical protein